MTPTWQSAHLTSLSFRGVPRLASFPEWVAGARPRTLPAALSAVFAGSGAALVADSLLWDRALLAGVVALSLQVGVNYANDYSDGVRGTDDVRTGPVRLVGQRLAAQGRVKAAAFGAFGVAGVAGLLLAALAGWWIIGVGVASILAAWYYTGGKHPYGYAGYGEIFTFVFFGLVATLGTEYVNTETVTHVGVLAAAGVGCLITALLVVNNLRDIPGDKVAGKKTLAVRLGDPATRKMYFGLMVAGIMLCGAAFIPSAAALVILVPLVLAMAPVRRVLRGAKGKELIAVLGQTGRVTLVAGISLLVSAVIVRAHP